MQAAKVEVEVNMATWDPDWQERQQQIDEAEYVGEYATRLELEREAWEQAESKAFDLAWDAAKPVAEKHAESIAKAIIAELSEAPSDALDVVAKRLDVGADADRLREKLARPDEHYWISDTVSDAVYNAVVEKLGGRE